MQIRVTLYRAGLVASLSVFAMSPALAAGKVKSGSASQASQSQAANQLTNYLLAIDTMQADFTQTTARVNATRGKRTTGTIYIQAPQRFRMEYKVPRQIIIGTGKRVYLNDLELKQISQRNQKEALKGTPAMVLTEPGRLKDNFKVSLLGTKEGIEWYELIPRSSQDQIQKINIGMKMGRIAMLRMVDNFSQETVITFNNVKTNIALQDKLFRLDAAKTSNFINF